MLLTADISIFYILWMWLYNFSRISSQSRTGRISAIFPEVLARYVNSTAVHCSAAPRGVSINRGASVVDSVAKDEGEDTVATGTRAWRGGGGGGSHGGGTVTAASRLVTKGSEGESVLCDDSGVV